ncbi:hypothetical protein [Bartonella sp. AP213QHHD]|uniref:hypothetical protein n=1 Tax=Bartonella sp. AP213QHHD TaxID=3243476 RepID=UPI0035D06BD7
MPIPSQVPRAVATVRLGKEKDRANLTEMKEGGRQGVGDILWGAVNFKSHSQSILEIKCVIEALDFEAIDFEATDFEAIETHGLKDGGFDEADGGWGKRFRLIGKTYKGKKREAKEE